MTMQKKIFEDAKAQLDAKKQINEPNINEKFAAKHAELADMYLQFKRYDESVEQYQKAVSLSTKKLDLSLRLAECFVQAGQKDRAIKELKALLQADPRLSAPRLKLGLILYNSHHIAEAVDQWENILRYDSKNQEAIRYLKMAQAAGVTTLHL